MNTEERDEVVRLFRLYIDNEGCGCCGNYEVQEEAVRGLADLLGVAPEDIDPHHRP